MWDIEEHQSCTLTFPQDKEAQQTALATLKKQQMDLWWDLPWNSVAPYLEIIYSMALTRLENAERKLTKQRKIASAYPGMIDSYKQKYTFLKLRSKLS